MPRIIDRSEFTDGRPVAVHRYRFGDIKELKEYAEPFEVVFELACVPDIVEVIEALGDPDVMYHWREGDAEESRLSFLYGEEFRDE